MDFEELFCKALTELVEKNGGSLDTTLSDLRIDPDSELAKQIKDWYGWEDEEDEYDFEGTGMSEEDIRDLTVDDMAKMGLYDESFEVQFADDDDNIFDGGYYDSLEEAKEAAIDGYSSDPDYTHFVVYDANGDVVFCEEDIIEDDDRSEMPWDYSKHFE